jgi:hypothetical protein
MKEHLVIFLARWQKAGGTQRANYQLFLSELCSLLGMPLPEQADALAAQFKRSPKIAVQAVLDALEELGMVQQDADQYRLAS